MAQTTSVTKTQANTDDATAILVSELFKIPNLLGFFIQLQVSASAGTALLEVLGPGGFWVTHVAGLDATANQLVNVSGTETERFQDARITFTGTSDTNSLSVNISRRPFK